MLDTFEGKKNYLKEYQKLKGKAIYLEDRLYGVRGVSYGEKYGDTQKTLVEKIQELEELHKKMNRISKSIDSLTDINERMLLTYVYKEGLSIQTVYNKRLMEYSYRQLRRIYKRGVENIVIK